jgi:Spy/CpxP family protein refolding chaperone
MKKTKKILVGSLIVITLGAVGALTAGGYGHGWGGDRGHMAVMMAERMMSHATKELDLTEAQQANLQALQQKVLSLRTEARMGKQETRQELMQQLLQPTLDQEHMMMMVRDRLQLAEQKAPEVIAALAVFSDSLTAEQKNKIKENIEKHKRHDRRERYHGDYPRHD